MAETQQRPLKVFLCHASGDKPAVRALYQRLIRDGVDAWLDREKLLPGQDWQLEIPKAVRESDVVIVCLSNKSITKEGYVQKEIKFALDIATEKPEGVIFLIPARLEDCNVPLQLASWQWVDLFESDGYERLMRSLRLRADKLGMRVGDTLYTDREMEQRLDQLYTEGLAALWVEDWDKAYHRFQTILREKPDHMQSIAKLDEAKRQKHWNALYTQAFESLKNEHWQAAVNTLETLTGEASDYKDATTLLQDARKKNQLAQLYLEAHRLHKAQQWQAVVKVFSQIAAMEPNYRDPDGLLPSAQKEVAELKRMADLRELYSRGVREIDAGNWYEARKLLEQVHKTQKGFLENERLLRKVEDEIIKIEERKQRNLQVNTLYEQAHELLRSKNWRKAAEKMEEVWKLDSQFVDKDGILESARVELDREEQIVQRQNTLAAMYTEAVRLLKEAKYQEALEKWQEVKTMDPKYPDRQLVQRTATRKLTDKAKSGRSKLPMALKKSSRKWNMGLVVISTFGIVGIIALVSVFLSIYSNGVDPSTIATVYDQFDDQTFDNLFNTSVWKPGINSTSYIAQQEGIMRLLIPPNRVEVVSLLGAKPIDANQNIYAQARILLSSERRGSNGDVSFTLTTKDKNNRDIIFWCGIGRSAIVQAWCEFWGRLAEGKAEYSTTKITTDYDTWHNFAIRVNPESNTVEFLIDGQTAGSYTPMDAEELKTGKFTFKLEVWNPEKDGIEGNFDDVNIEYIPLAN